MWSRRRVDGSFPRDNFRPPIFSGSTSFPLPLRRRFCAREVLKNESRTERRDGRARLGRAKTRRSISTRLNSRGPRPFSSRSSIAYPFPGTNAREGERPSLSRCRESSLKNGSYVKRKRERREDDANRATVSSLSRRERKQRTYAKRCHLVRVLLKMGVDVSVRVLRANKICRFYS